MGNNISCQICTKKENIEEFNFEEDEDIKQRQKTKNKNYEILKNKQLSINKDCFLSDDYETPSLRVKSGNNTDRYSKNSIVYVKEEEREKTKIPAKIEISNFADLISFKDVSSNKKTLEFKIDKNNDDTAKQGSIVNDYKSNGNQKIDINKPKNYYLNDIESNNLSPIRKIEDNLSIQTNLLANEGEKEKNIISSKSLFKLNKAKDDENKQTGQSTYEDKLMNKFSVFNFNLDSIYNKKILSNDIISIKYQDNSQYIGIYDTNQNPTGMGKLINHNLEYIGEFKDSLINGFGIYKLANSIVYSFKQSSILINYEKWSNNHTFEGVYYSNLKSIGKYTWSNKSVYEGEIENGYYSGYGILTIEEKIYKGNWKLSKLNGYSEINLDKNKKYRGFCKDDLKEGFGIFDWGNDKIYIGFWSKNKQSGIGKLITNKNSKYGLWSSGERLSWFNNEKEALTQMSENALKYKKIFLLEYEKILSLLNN